jgi:5-methyltetrahydrofolate--homocysteine methyltransferase
MEQWEPCCNGTISPKKILEENVSRFSTFAKGNNDLLSLTQPHAKKYTLLILKLELILLKPPSQEPRSVWPITILRICLWIELWIRKIAREVADEFTAKKPDKPRFVWVQSVNKQQRMSPDVNDPDTEP